MIWLVTEWVLWEREENLSLSVPLSSNKMRVFKQLLGSAVSGVLGFSVITLASGDQVGMRTADVKLTHEFAKRVALDHHDTCRRMANSGIDYPVLIQRALDGDLNAIRLFLFRHEVFRVDGAVAASYSQTRFKLAMLVGDEKLTSALQTTAKHDYPLLRRSFLGWPNPQAEDPAKAEAEMRTKLPKFWALLSRKAGEKE